MFQDPGLQYDTTGKSLDKLHRFGQDLITTQGFTKLPLSLKPQVQFRWAFQQNELNEAIYTMLNSREHTLEVS